MSTTPRIEPDLQREDYYRRYREAMSHRYRTFDPLTMEALFNLIQTYSCSLAQLSASLQEAGMTPPGLNILGILRQHKPDGCSLSTLSHLLLVSQANITGVVDSLVRKGFVLRQEHSKDRRITMARITSAGEKWLDGYLPTHYARARDLFAGLNAAEKRTFIKLLNKLRQSSCRHPRGEKA